MQVRVMHAHLMRVSTVRGREEDRHGGPCDLLTREPPQRQLNFSSFALFTMVT